MGNSHGTNQVVLSSTRTLDGVDKMTAFMDEGTNRMPEVDMHPAAGQNGLNQYSSFGGFDRNYDKNGGLQDGLDVAIPGGATAEKGLRFDALKRLSAVLDEFGATEMTYAYDPIGRRIAKLDAMGDIDTQYFYDGGWRVLEERDDLGMVTKQFVDGAGIDEHVQYRAFDALGITSDYYYHCNEQGFVGALTDNAGAVTEQYEYKWLGEVVVLGVAGVPVTDDLTTNDVDESREGLFGNPYTFQGRRLDPETGLYHFRNRQYDPATGSFASVDPSGLWRHGQGNGYSAFGSDPWNWLDPLGLTSLAAGGQVWPDNTMGPIPGGDIFESEALRRCVNPMPRQVACARCHGTADGSYSNIARGDVPANSYQSDFLASGGDELLAGGRVGKTVGVAITLGLATSLPLVGDGLDAGVSAVQGDLIGVGTALLPGPNLRRPKNPISPQKIHPGKQGKHIKGHNNQIAGKSVLSADPDELIKCAGTGKQVGNVKVGLPGSKERIDFGETIGDYIDPSTGVKTPTSNGIIHYIKGGAHIVPARP